MRSGATVADRSREALPVVQRGKGLAASQADFTGRDPGFVGTRGPRLMALLLFVTEGQERYCLGPSLGPPRATDDDRQRPTTTARPQVS